MARTVNNVITRKISGKLGQVVFQKNDVMRTRPDMSDRVLSEKQKSHLAKFEAAKSYARSILADPEKIAEYSRALLEWKKIHGKGNIGIYQLAIRDFMNGSVPRD
jgi:hypothetical protein